MDVDLSERAAARLAIAARRSGASESDLIEAALDRFLALDDTTSERANLSRRLDGMARQLEQLDHDLRIVSETVALHARFHLAIAPLVPAAKLPAACRRGAERFEEFTSQVDQRLRRRAPLVQEPLDRAGAATPAGSAGDQRRSGVTPQTSRGGPSGLDALTRFGKMTGSAAAVREDGSKGNFP
ncbi:hypothetical protein [Bradyrhizobium sp. NP1]|uniref:hypothetical protein n=1 Tax=Bradyrhizobium sp. NP1 TaxID=3049772 RepID=UPI0025A4DCAF|nr:hypothetical protein [Bradyrhizobium sp. NP1]WJR75504.1 hypothetical protein QOU61_22175 [Bradyrhizobium sp. NP1]